MIKKCFGCGIEKDLSVDEIYPYPEEDCITEDSCPPLFVIECQGENQEFRIVVVCHECFHKLSPDMWISQKCWESLNPIVPFEKLPFPVENEMWSIENYSFPLD